MSKMQLRDQIEMTVRDRNLKAARPLIRKFMRISDVPMDLLTCCEWYRRLGLYREGYLLLKDLNLPTQSLASNTNQGQKLLWFARFLNWLGASQYASQILGFVDLVDSESLSIGAGIYLADFDHAKAEELYRKSFELATWSNSYSMRLAKLGLADALGGLGRFDEALVESEFETSSDESLLKGIKLQAQGEYLARAGAFQKSLELFKKSRLFFSEEDQSTDRALLEKWQGYVECKLGNEKGLEKLDIAYNILRECSFRDEAWLDVDRLRLEVDELSPRSLDELRLHPGLSSWMKEQLNVESTYKIESVDPSTIVYMDSREGKWSGKRQLALSKEIELLALLKLAGSQGLSMMKVFTFLWPDELYALDQMEQRIAQILRRLRVLEHIGIEMDNRRLTLVKGMDTISVYNSGNKKPIFLSTFSDFKTSDLQNYYNLSNSQARNYIRYWMETGWIERTGSGRQTFYRISEL